MSSSARPFKILGVQQIAIGCETRKPLADLWQGIFGLDPVGSHRLEGENVEEDILALGPAPFQVEVDLMTPIDPEKSPKVRYTTSDPRHFHCPYPAQRLCVSQHYHI